MAEDDGASEGKRGLVFQRSHIAEKVRKRGRMDGRNPGKVREGTWI